MTYIECVNYLLKPHQTPKYLAIDLFAGCGGLSLGFEAAGIETIGFEKDNDACNSYNSNLLGFCFRKELNVYTEFPSADIVIGGPPCQPFSINGHQLGKSDSRNGFPVCISAIEQISPEVFVLENVKGLIGKNKWYLESVIEQLESLGYFISINLLNAKDFLVPQNRERVFIIGAKKRKIEIKRTKNFLVTAGYALGNMALTSNEKSKFLTPEMDTYIKKYEIASKCKVPRNLHLDKPSRTLTCRNLAGSTGDMLRIQMPNGNRRQLSIKESARLQSFPDWYTFSGTETSQFNQIGNAVSPMMAFHVANNIINYFEEQH